MKTRTSYFVSEEMARRYYGYENATLADIAGKVEEGLIHIGKPELKPGEKLITIDNGARYAVEKLITRAEYMADSKNLHQAYYLELARHAGLTERTLPVSLERIRKALETDEHMNNIPLYLWDLCVTPHVRSAIAQVNIVKEGTCTSSLNDGVCALKALARHLAERVEQ